MILGWVEKEGGFDERTEHRSQIKRTVSEAGARKGRKVSGKDPFHKKSQRFLREKKGPIKKPLVLQNRELEIKISDMEGTNRKKKSRP